jgi:predicted N-acyltransferase
MGLSFRIFETIDDVPSVDWDCPRARAGSPFFQDRRFIAAVEMGMGRASRFRHVIIYDGGLPLACASLTGLNIDLATMADPRLAGLIRGLPAVMSRFRNLKTLFCGLPVSAGQSGIALASRDGARSVMSVLDDVVSRLAAEWKMHGVIYKEFGEGDLAWTNVLLDRGYSRVATPPRYLFPPRFNDLQDYCLALRSNYRTHIKGAMQKLVSNGVNVSILTDYAQIRKIYTPEVHSLYDQVVDQADLKFERLPIEFFHEFARRLDGEVELVVLSRNARVLAFGWNLRSASSYHLLFGGVDYALNTALALYFNLVYASLDRALRARVATIEVGQTADSFKAKLGCHPQPLYAFTRGVGPLMAWLVRWAAPLLVARTPVPPSYNIFRRGADCTRNDERAPGGRADCPA